MASSISNASTQSLSMAEKNRNNPVTSLRGDPKAFVYSFLISVQLDIIEKTKPTDLSEYTVSIVDYEYFEQANIPYLIVKFSLPQNIAMAIKDDYRNLVFSITKKRSRVLKNKENLFEKPVLVWTEKAFRVLEPDRVSPTVDISKGNTESGGAMTNAICALTLTFFEEDCLNIQKEAVNVAYKDVTVTDILRSLLSKYNKKKLLVIEKSSNSTKYESIVIPPMSFPDTIDYLQKYYEIYKNGVKYFIGYDYIIIADKSSNICPSTIFDTVELNFVNENPSANINPEYTYVDKDKKMYVFYLSVLPTLKIKDVTMKEVQGKEIIVNGRNNTQVTKGGGGIKDNGKDKQMYYWNPTSIEHFADIFANELNESVEVMSVTLPSCLDDILYTTTKLNTVYNTKINAGITGIYRISAVVYTYTLRQFGTQMDTGEPNRFNVRALITFLRT